MSFASRTMDAFSRRKVFDDLGKTPLARVLGIFDLTALGVGATLGVGVYVLAGEVAKSSAGPAVVLSFFIAAIASVFAGISYAEFGARVPRAGSAYIYSYVTVGEFIAFVIGWNLILEYCIGAASVVRGLSTYIDSLTGYVISGWFLEVMPMHVSFLSEYPDFFAFGITMIFAVGLAFGMRESSLVNNVFTVLNLSVVVFVIICGAINADFSNWSIDPTTVPPEVAAPAAVGAGGFFPFGFSGVVKGAAKCFYGFIGFDCIATTGEEAKNPKRNIPLSIVVSLTIIFLAYFGVSSVLTLMLPYYLQDENAPLPHAFEEIGWIWAKWVVSIGAIFGLLASLFGSLYPLPRILYAMSADGLLFSFMGRIHPRFKTPIFGTLLAGFVTATMAAFFNLSQLVSMMSIGTLMAYSIVAACVTLLRYKDIVEPGGNKTDDTTLPAGDSVAAAMNALDAALPGVTAGKPGVESGLPTPTRDEDSSCLDVVKQLVNLKRVENTTGLSADIVMWAMIAFCLVCICEISIVIYWFDGLSSGDGSAVATIVVTSLVLVTLLIVISLQPRATIKLSFTVPAVPWIPGISILINIALMMELDAATWWRFLIWMAVGFAIYFGYGIRHSRESPRYKSRPAAVGEANLSFEQEDVIDRVEKDLKH